MKRSLILGFFVIALGLLSACDGGENYVNGYHPGSTDFSFNYYYVQSCYYDSYDEYVCDNQKSLRSRLQISIEVESDGFVTLYYNDHSGYSFHDTFLPSEYDRDYDGRYYFQFPMDGGSLTVYEDGGEAIYSDYVYGTEDHYYYDWY